MHNFQWNWISVEPRTEAEAMAGERSTQDDGRFWLLVVVAAASFGLGITVACAVLLTMSPPLR